MRSFLLQRTLPQGRELPVASREKAVAKIDPHNKELRPQLTRLSPGTPAAVPKPPSRQITVAACSLCMSRAAPVRLTPLQSGSHKNPPAESLPLPTGKQTTLHCLRAQT